MIRLLLLVFIVLAVGSHAGGSLDGYSQGAASLWAQLQASIKEYQQQQGSPQPAAGAPIQYVATGDSVASGDDLGTACSSGHSCDNRDLAYPALLASIAQRAPTLSVSLTDLSCSGATTWNYTHDAQCGARGPQVGQLAGANWVTITVGADDLMQWLTNNRQCVLDQRVADLLGKRPQDCDLLAKVVQPFESNLREIFDKATANADVVVVTQYYHVFSPSFSPAVTHLPYNWTEGVNEGIDLLDQSVANVASAYGNKILVVDLRPVFATHEWGDSDSYITRLHSCSLVDLATPWSVCWWVPGIHPNAAGQRAIADELWARISRRVGAN